MIDFEKAREKLKGQEHLLAYWEKLTSSQKAHLLQQIEGLDLNLLKRQQALLLYPPAFDPAPLSPITTFSPEPGDRERGLQLMSQGKVACLVVAGGQGTRLGFNGPKGAYPISLIQHKTLFQLLAEKTKAASKQVGHPLSLAIMTSPLNHAATLAYFEQNDFFGLEQLSFFKQSLLPFLDSQGKMFLEAPDAIALAPDGNGSAFQGLFEAGIWGKWRALGIDLVNYVLIDNPLADPFDAPLIGFHARQGNEITVKGTPRLNADEKVGLLVQKNGSCKWLNIRNCPKMNAWKGKMAPLSTLTPT